MVISITNLKGGVGKSTIAQNLAVCFAHKKLSVCLVDTDTQLQVGNDWGKDRGADLPPIYIEVVHQDEISKRVLALKNQFDLVIIDGTPALFELSSRAVLLSDMVLIPILPSIEEVRTLERFLHKYDEARLTKESLGGRVQAYIVLNKYSETLRIDRDVSEIIPKFGVPVLKTKLANRVAYREAKIEGRGVAEYSDPKARDEMNRLADEVGRILIDLEG